MQQFKSYTLWIFRGDETTQSERDKRLVLPESWYVGDKPGSAIMSGPHSSEAAARCDAELMTDTSGT